MATNTKEALAAAMKKMLAVKPVDKITVKDLVEECGVNRQTFYYHFDDVYDLLEWVFEQDANRVLPSEIGTDIVEERLRECVHIYFHYLADNKSMVLNIYNSQRPLLYAALLPRTSARMSTASPSSRPRARTSTGPTWNSWWTSMSTAWWA